MTTHWTPWQLADDPATYGPHAGRYILTSPDGEDEHPGGVIYATEEDAERAAADFDRVQAA